MLIRKTPKFVQIFVWSIRHLFFTVYLQASSKKLEHQVANVKSDNLKYQIEQMEFALSHQRFLYLENFPYPYNY